MRILLIAVILHLLPSFVLAQPAIHFETEHHDFGDVRPGDQPAFTFLFRNSGTGLLEIRDVSTS